MSLRGISKHVSSDFFEVMIIFSLKNSFNLFSLFHLTCFYAGCSSKNAWQRFCPKSIYFCPRICQSVNSITPLTLLRVIWSILFPNLQWDPPSLKEISEDMVEYYFSPLSEVQSELVLPTALREPYMWNKHTSKQCSSLTWVRQTSSNLVFNFIKSISQHWSSSSNNRITRQSVAARNIWAVDSSTVHLAAASTFNASLLGIILRQNLQ